MKIRDLIDQKYTMVSIVEDTRDVFEWLKFEKYLVIMDECNKTRGIITINDLLNNPTSRNVFDCSFEKPSVYPEQTIFEVFNIMRDTGNEYLPVYNRNDFVGVIILMKITGRIVEVFNEKKIDCQKTLTDLRNSIVNMYGLANLIDESTAIDEAKEILQIAKKCCDQAMNILERVEHEANK